MPEYTGAVLRNRGVPVEFYAVERTPDTVDEATDDVVEVGKWQRVAVTGKQKRAVEARYVRFDFNVISDIEQAFGDVEAWQAAMVETPATAIRRSLAIAFYGWDGPDDPKENERRVGAGIIDGALGDYSSAIGIAWSLANGLDPTKAAKVLTEAAEANEVAKLAIEKQIEEGLESPTEESPGSNS